MNGIVYLLQVSTCIGGFYLFYHFLLNNLTFFTINRWYLTVTLALSFVIPVITITVDTEYVSHFYKSFYVPQIQNFPTHQIVDFRKGSGQPVLSWLDAVVVAYFIPVVLLSILLMRRLVSFLIQIKSTNRVTIGSIHIIRGIHKISNGSFFNYIFLNDRHLNDDVVRHIIKHELLHVNLLHSFDRLILEISKIILWFNPFIYFYAQAVEENHEFEVDQKLIDRFTDKGEYADLLLSLSVTSQKIPYHSFSKLPLEKRIQMIFKQPTKKMKKITYVLILPLALVSCLAFAKLNIVRNPIVNKPQRQLLAKPERIAGSSSPAPVDTATDKRDKPTNSTPLIVRQTTFKSASQDQSSFYVRKHIRNSNGESFDKVTFKLANGSASANLGPEDKLGVFIDGSFYTEADLKKLPAEKTASLTFSKCGDDFRYKIPDDASYAIPFCFKSKTAGDASDAPELKQIE